MCIYQLINGLINQSISCRLVNCFNVAVSYHIGYISDADVIFFGFLQTMFSVG